MSCLVCPLGDAVTLSCMGSRLESRHSPLRNGLYACRMRKCAETDTSQGMHIDLCSKRRICAPVSLVLPLTCWQGVKRTAGVLVPGGAVAEGSAVRKREQRCDGWGG